MVSFILLEFMISLIYPFLSLGSFLLQCGLIVWVAAKILAFCVHEYRKYTDPWYYVTQLVGFSSLASVVSHMMISFLEEKKTSEERMAQSILEKFDSSKNLKPSVPTVNHDDSKSSKPSIPTVSQHIKDEKSEPSVIFELMKNEIFMKVLQKFLIGNDLEKPIDQTIKEQTGLFVEILCKELCNKSEEEIRKYIDILCESILSFSHDLDDSIVKYIVRCIRDRITLLYLNQNTRISVTEEKKATTSSETNPFEVTTKRASDSLRTAEIFQRIPVGDSR